MLEILKEVRSNGISSDIYPTAAKIQKQMKYANARSCEYVAMVGENEMMEGKIALKNMATGEQKNVSPSDLISILR